MWSRLLSAVSFTAVAAGVLAAPAGADTQQNFRYCEALERNNMIVTDCGMASAVGMGQCEHFDTNHRTWRDAMNTTRDMWGYTPSESATVLLAAIAVYCPWNANEVPHP